MELNTLTMNDDILYNFNQVKNTRSDMEYSLRYELVNEEGNRVADGEALCRLDEEGLSILAESGGTLYVSHRDLAGIAPGDYRLTLSFVSGEELIIYHLGRAYEDFTRELIGRRNEIILRDMLVGGTAVRPDTKVSFSLKDGRGAEVSAGSGRVRLYETALVLLPDSGDPVSIPYSNIVEVRDADRNLNIREEAAGELTLSMMGKEFDPFRKALQGSINELDLRTQTHLKGLVPSASPLVLTRVSRLMRDGRAAKKIELDDVAPGFWDELEKMLDLEGIRAEYDFLKSMAIRDKMCIGRKRGLMGDLTGEYTWFLIPIETVEPERLGNAIAMEATSAQGSSKATYFFRVMNRDEYRGVHDGEAFEARVDQIIGLINNCMQKINFRREPIYLPEERLREPRYARYRFSLARLPELRELRNIFIGRVIHYSHEQWKRDVLDLLRFNVTADDDGKWRSREDSLPEGNSIE